MLRPHHARGTCAVLWPSMRHLSPAIGLAFTGSHLLGRLHELDPPSGDAAHSSASLLVTQLFHRNQREEPIFPTTNRSLAAAHLSASLTAHIGGIATAGLGANAAHAALRRATCSETGLTLPQLARETGVTIARFERLVEQVRAADGTHVAQCIGIENLGSALLMRHLWLRSNALGKSALWTYLKTLHECYGPALTSDAVELFDSPGSKKSRSWMESAFSQTDLAPAAIARAANLVLLGCEEDGGASGGASCSHAAEASAFELVVAASSQAANNRSPPLRQGKYGYRGQPAVADCAELVTRELLNALLWCEDSQSFDATRLPASACQSLRAFYATDGAAQQDRRCADGSGDALGPSPHATQRVRLGSLSVAEWFEAPPAESKASQQWMDLVSGLPRVQYLCGGGGYKRDAARTAAGEASLRYEMAPTVGNVFECLAQLLGQPSAVSAAGLEAIWASAEPERGVRLRVVTDREGARIQMLELSEPAAKRAEGGAGLRVALELVMSPDLNHAFAVHNWAPRPWQSEVAQLCLASLRRHVSLHEGAGGALWSPPPMPLLRGVLLPSLLQPVLPLAARPFVEGTFESPRDLRLQLLCTSPKDERAIGFCLLRLVASLQAASLQLASLQKLAGPGHGPGTPEASRSGPGAVQEEETAEESVEERELGMSLGVAARVLSLATGGLEELSDSQILAVAEAAATAPGEALHAMALRHPPLAAPAAVLRSAPGSREAWWRSCASDWRTGGEPWGANVQNMLRSARCVRLSVLAVPAAVRLRLGLSRYKARAS